MRARKKLVYQRNLGKLDLGCKGIGIEGYKSLNLVGQDIRQEEEEEEAEEEAAEGIEV